MKLLLLVTRSVHGVMTCLMQHPLIVSQFVVIIQDHIDINFEKRFYMGQIPLPAARKDMIIKIIRTGPPTTASNVIVCSGPKIICNPRFATNTARLGYGN